MKSRVVVYYLSQKLATETALKNSLLLYKRILQVKLSFTFLGLKKSVVESLWWNSTGTHRLTEPQGVLYESVCEQAGGATTWGTQLTLGQCCSPPRDAVDSWMAILTHHHFDISFLTKRTTVQEQIMALRQMRLRLLWDYVDSLLWSRF